jgi:glutathione S-transferase
MTTPILVIGDKHASSWSLRPWLALRMAGVAFEERVIRLYQQDTAAQIRAYSPTGKVPCLIDGDVVVWDSLAICETIAESHPSLWPIDAGDRARARAVSNEMHAGFQALRQQCSMYLKGNKPTPPLEGALLADVERVVALWTQCLQRSGGPFLFGRFSIADAMYAPVVTRFTTYGLPMTDVVRGYASSIWALPAMIEWRDAALNESY